MNKPISIFEYGHLSYEDGAGDAKKISRETFEELEVFLSNLDADAERSGKEMQEVLRFSSRNGKRTIKALNHVGVISAGDATIEILPKIGKIEGNAEKTREVFLAMLATLDDARFKNLGQARLATKDYPLLEVFISAFLDEVSEVIKRGLCSDYMEISGNERFLKGRLNFNEHIKHNHSDRSRFAIEYCAYHVDRPENRLIKSAVIHALKRSRNQQNRRRARIALDYLAEVSPSINARADFTACKNDRNLAHYRAALDWCRLLLAHEAPVSTPGVFTTNALLFPMETIFESYVASRLKDKRIPDVMISVQDQGKCLFDTPKKYSLRPDLVVRQKSDPEERKIILDTKWKIPNGGPSQSDMYQMFAYAARYGAEHVVLIYPQPGKKQSSESEEPATKGPIYKTKIGKREVQVHTFFYRLPESALLDDGIEKLADFLSQLLSELDYHSECHCSKTEEI